MSTETHTAPREYPWRMPVTWWTRSRHYFLYIAREFSALPMALWLLWLLVEIQRAAGGPAQYHPHSSPAFVAFSVIVLAFSLYHSYATVKGAPSLIRVKIFDRQVPPGVIVLAMCGAWAAASAVVGFVLIWFGR